jgi:hypothetical protein
MLTGHWLVTQKLVPVNSPDAAAAGSLAHFDIGINLHCFLCLIVDSNWLAG